MSVPEIGQPPQAVFRPYKNIISVRISFVKRKSVGQTAFFTNCGGIQVRSPAAQAAACLPKGGTLRLLYAEGTGGELTAGWETE